MAIVDKKKQVFGKIAAFKTLTESLPKLKKTSSLPSINNGGDSISFLSDLIKSLIGYEALKSSVSEILSNSLPTIEKNIKHVLATDLKSLVSCGVDPHLPDWLKSTGAGITIPVSKIDFLDMLRTDPNTLAGSLIYNDITPTLTNSSDFNTFLYGVIQDDGITHTWQNILDFTFNSVGVGSTPNNTITIKANPSYNTKTLTDLNNDYIYSNTFLNTENVLTKTIDFNFGTISTSKSLKQLEEEAKINAIIDKMVNNLNKDPMNDDAFAFSKEETLQNELNAYHRKKGYKPLNLSLPTSANPTGGVMVPMVSTVPVQQLTGFTTSLSASTTPLDRKETIDSALESMANATTSAINNFTDKPNVKLNFIQNILDTFIKAIVSIFLSPKVMMAFVINYKIIYGPTSDFDGAIDFIKKNKQLMSSIMKAISEEIIKILLAVALKEISSLVSAAMLKKQKERATNRLAQMQTLLGVPKSQVNSLLNSI
jgi:hypothetical protein